MTTSDFIYYIYFTLVIYSVKDSNCRHYNLCCACDERVSTAVFPSSSGSPAYLMVWFSTKCLCTLSGTAVEFFETLSEANHSCNKGSWI